MKKKIAFIMNEYPAKTSPTCIAVEPIIRELANKYEIHCIVKRSGKSNTVTIHCVKQGLIDYIIERLRTSGKDKAANIVNTLYMRISQMFTAPIYPQIHPIFQKRLNKLTLAVCNENKIDLLVSVCFPGESIVAGAYVKKHLPNIKYVPYFIDAYSCGTLPKYLPKKYAFQRKLDYERECVKQANLVITMEASKEFHEQHNKLYHAVYLNPAFLSRPVDINMQNLRNDILEKGYINILYAGYIYMPDRDPSYIIDTLSGMENVCLIFVGKNEARKIIEQKQKSFKGIIKQFDFVNHDELVGLMRSADIFLNLGVSNVNAISGKIFEYMAYGKPIISTYFKENEATLSYLKQYPLSCCINQTNVASSDAAQTIQQFIIESGKKLVKYEEVERRFYASTPMAFEDVITPLLSQEV